MSEREQELREIALRLGQAAQKCEEEEKNAIRDLYAKVKEFAENRRQTKDIEVDRTAFFAVGIIFHPDVNSEEVVQAAEDYVDQHVIYVKNLS